MPKITEIQQRADKKYRETHRKKRTHLSYKATAKTFIRHWASDDELEELMELISEKRRFKNGK